MTEQQQGRETEDERFSEEELRTGVPAAKKLKKYIFSILFMTVLIVVTFCVIFKDNSVDEIMSVVLAADLRWVLAGFAAIIACRLFQALAIKLSARCVGYRITYGEAVQSAMVNVFYSGITPSSTGGQPMQIFYFARDKMTLSGATLTIFTVNIAFHATMLVVSFLALAYLADYVAATSGALFALFAIGVLADAAIILLLLVVMFSENTLRKIVNWGMRVGLKLRLVKNEEKARRSVEAYISEIKKGDGLIKKNSGRFLAVFGVTMLQVLSYHLIPFCVYMSFGMQTGFNCIDLMAISAFLFVSVSFMPLPGTVGAAERGFVILYRYVFPGHVLAATLLSRFINFYTIIIIAGIFAIYIQMRKPHNISSRTRKMQKTE